MHSRWKKLNTEDINLNQRLSILVNQPLGEKIKSVKQFITAYSHIHITTLFWSH